jgi:hypothetical protein
MPKASHAARIAIIGLLSLALTQSASAMSDFNEMKALAAQKAPALPLHGPGHCHWGRNCTK